MLKHHLIADLLLTVHAKIPIFLSLHNVMISESIISPLGCKKVGWIQFVNHRYFLDSSKKPIWARPQKSFTYNKIIGLNDETMIVLFLKNFFNRQKARAPSKSNKELYLISIFSPIFIGILLKTSTKFFIEWWSSKSSWR